jgi:hypothetical protein
MSETLRAPRDSVSGSGLIRAVFVGLLLVSLSAHAANPAKRLCFATCKQTLAACKADATSARDTAKAACPLDRVSRRACLTAAKVAFKAARKACKTDRKECKGCCKRTGAVCTTRPDDLPPPFETGTASADISLDSEGCLPGGNPVVVTTDRGVSVELGDTCLATWDGERITGPVTLRIDDAGGILAQGSPGFLQGVIRLVVDAPAVAGRFVALDRPMKVRVELDDGTLPGDWEVVTWVDGATYAAGPATQGTRPEVELTLVPIRRDGPEEFEYWGSGPIGIRYVAPPTASASAAAISPRGAGANVITIDLLHAGLSPDFPTRFPFLCAWEVIGGAGRVGQYLAIERPRNLPHGQSSVTADYTATVRTAGAPTFEVASPYFNRVLLAGWVCELDYSVGTVGSQDFADLGRGGSPEEAHLPGPYDGRMILQFGGSDLTIFDDVLEILPTAFPPPMRAVIRRFSLDYPPGSGFDLVADVFHHPESVRRIASVFPSHWRYEFEDRYAVVNTTPTTITTSSSTTTTSLPSLLRVLECTRSASAEGTAFIRDGLSDGCFDSAVSPETAAACVATTSFGDTNASGSGEASFASSVTGGEVVSSLTASATAAASASGGGPLVHGASGSGSARVQCFVAADGPLSFNASGGGSASPDTSFSSVEVLFRVDGGAAIARFEQAGGEVFDSFPASGTLEPGFYEIVVRVVAEANLVRAGSGTAEASFTLTVGTAP